MSNNIERMTKTTQVTCFGEVLWDNLPAGKKPGGAPMNVAYHLKSLNVSGAIISRVGNDADGIELLQAVKGLGLSTTYCQIDKEHPTSTVEVIIGNEGDIVYDIVNDVAWDYIEYDARFEPLVHQSDAFVFGSLSGRNVTTRETLDGLLDMASYKVFDINLRPPFFDKDRLMHLLKKTDLLKLNQDELAVILDWYGSSYQIKLVQDKFDINEIVLTKGGNGVSYYQGHEGYNYPSYKIQVKDAVGSGDSFLAALLSKKLQGADVITMLSFASAVAAFVTTQAGACPAYTMADIDRFKAAHTLNAVF